MNRVVLIGRLVRDPELKKTNSGTPVVSFTLAVDNRQRTNGERSASFFPCTAWKATAENVAHFMKKGSLVAVDGRLNQRSYVSSRDGRNVNVIEIVAEQVQFLEKKGGENNLAFGNDAPAPDDYSNSEEPSSTGIDGSDEELPF